MDNTPNGAAQLANQDSGSPVSISSIARYGGTINSTLVFGDFPITFLFFAITPRFSSFYCRI